MSKKILLNVLLSAFGDYIEGISPDNLKVAVWAGDIELYDLNLNGNSLKKFNLPVDIIHGSVKTFKVHIPWTHLESQAVKVEIDGVYCLLSPFDRYGLTEEELRKRMLKHKRDKIQAATKALLEKQAAIAEEELNNKKTEEEKKENAGYVQRLVTKIIDNLEVTVRNVSIRYEDNISIPNTIFSFGITLSEFAIHTTNGDWELTFVDKSDKNKDHDGNIYKLINIDNFSLYWECNAEPFKDLRSNKREESLKNLITSPKQLIGNYLLEPSSLSVRASRNRSINTEKPDYTIYVVVPSLPLTLAEKQINQVLQLKVSLDEIEIWKQRYQWRPKKRPIDSKSCRDWWKYAYRCITDYPGEIKWKDTIKTLTKRNEYINLYSKKLKWEKALLNESDKDAKKRLKANKNYIMIDNDKISDLNENEKNKFENLEESINMNSLIYWRHYAHNKYEKEEQLITKIKDKQKQIENKKGWLGGWFGSSKNTDNETKIELDDDDISLSTLEEDIAKSFEDINDVTASVEASKLSFFISIDTTTTLKILSGGGGSIMKPIMLISTKFNGSYHKKKGLEGDRLLFDLRSLNIEDKYTPNAVFTQICNPIKDGNIPHEMPLLAIEYVTQPDLDNPTFSSTNVMIKSLPLNIVYNPQFVSKVVAFFNPPEISSYSIAARVKEIRDAGLEEAKKIAKEKLLATDLLDDDIDDNNNNNNNEEEKKKKKKKRKKKPSSSFHLNIDAHAPTFHILIDPRNDVGGLILDSGHLFLEGNLNSLEGTSEWYIKLENINSFLVENMNRFYHSDNNHDTNALIDPFDINIDLTLSPAIKTLPNIDVDATVSPYIRGSLSPFTLGQLLDITKGLTILSPEEEEKKRREEENYHIVHNKSPLNVTINNSDLKQMSAQAILIDEMKKNEIERKKQIEELNTDAKRINMNLNVNIPSVEFELLDDFIETSSNDKYNKDNLLLLQLKLLNLNAYIRQRPYDMYMKFNMSSLLLEDKDTMRKLELKEPYYFADSNYIYNNNNEIEEKKNDNNNIDNELIIIEMNTFDSSHRSPYYEDYDQKIDVLFNSLHLNLFRNTFNTFEPFLTVLNDGGDYYVNEYQFQDDDDKKINRHSDTTSIISIASKASIIMKDIENKIENNIKEKSILLMNVQLNSLSAELFNEDLDGTLDPIILFEIKGLTTDFKMDSNNKNKEDDYMDLNLNLAELNAIDQREISKNYAFKNLITQSILEKKDTLEEKKNNEKSLLRVYFHSQLKNIEIENSDITELVELTEIDIVLEQITLNVLPELALSSLETTLSIVNELTAMLARSLKKDENNDIIIKNETNSRNKQIQNYLNKTLSINYNKNDNTSDINLKSGSSKKLPNRRISTVAKKKTKLDVSFRMENPRIILIEDVTNIHSKGIVIETTISLDFVRSVITELESNDDSTISTIDSINVSLSGTESFVDTDLNSISEPYSIIEPFSLDLFFENKVINNIPFAMKLNLDIDIIEIKISFRNALLFKDILMQLIDSYTLHASLEVEKQKLLKKKFDNTKNIKENINDLDVSIISEEKNDDDNDNDNNNNLKRRSSQSNIVYIADILMSIGDIHFVLVNDFGKISLPVISLSTSSFDLSLSGPTTSLTGGFNTNFHFSFYNPLGSIWEPIIEDISFQFIISTNQKLDRIIKFTTPDDGINISISSTFLSSLLSTYSILFGSMEYKTNKNKNKILNIDENNISRLYFINNQTGIDLKFYKWEINDQSELILNENDIIYVKDNEKINFLNNKNNNNDLIFDPLEYSLTLSFIDNENFQSINDIPTIGQGRSVLPVKYKSDDNTENKNDNTNSPRTLHPVIEEIWQYQRNPLFGKWKAPFLPGDPSEFSNYEMNTKKSIENSNLPSNDWEWSDDWHIDRSEELLRANEIDQEGWDYSVDFGSFRGNSIRRGKKGALDCVRRRRWLRTRVPINKNNNNNNNNNNLTTLNKNVSFNSIPLYFSWDILSHHDGTTELRIRSQVHIKNETNFLLSFGILDDNNDIIFCNNIEKNNSKSLPFNKLPCNQIFIKPNDINNEDNNLNNEWKYSEPIQFTLGVSDKNTHNIISCRTDNNNNNNNNNINEIYFSIELGSKNGIIDIIIKSTYLLINSLPCKLQYKTNLSSYTNEIEPGKEMSIHHLNPINEPKLSLHIDGFSFSEEKNLYTYNEELLNERKKLPYYDIIYTLTNQNGEELDLLARITENNYYTIIDISCKYWIVDRTALFLGFKDPNNKNNNIRLSHDKESKINENLLYDEKQNDNIDDENDDEILVEYLSNLRIRSRKKYNLIQLKPGIQIYNDEEFIWKTIPNFLLNLNQPCLLQTSYSDATSQAESFIKFKLNINSLIFILYDSKANDLPKWLKINFKLISGKNSAITIRTSKNGKSIELTYLLYCGWFGKNDTVILGGNKIYENNIMYSILLSKAKDKEHEERRLMSLSSSFRSSTRELNDSLSSVWSYGRGGMCLFSSRSNKMIIGVRDNNYSTFTKDIIDIDSYNNKAPIEIETNNSLYEIVINNTIVPGNFGLTSRLIKFFPRFVIINCMDETLEIKQKNSNDDSLIKILPNHSSPFHWSNKNNPREILLRLSDLTNWSYGSIVLTNIGAQVIQLPTGDLSNNIILHIEIQLSQLIDESAINIVIWRSDLSPFPLYKIRNLTNEYINLHQKCLDKHDQFQERSLYEYNILPINENGKVNDILFGWALPNEKKKIKFLLPKLNNKNNNKFSDRLSLSKRKSISSNDDLFINYNKIQEKKFVFEDGSQIIASVLVESGTRILYFGYNKNIIREYHDKRNNYSLYEDELNDKNIDNEEKNDDNNNVEIANIDKDKKNTIILTLPSINISLIRDYTSNSQSALFGNNVIETKQSREEMFFININNIYFEQKTSLKLKEIELKIDSIQMDSFVPGNICDVILYPNYIDDENDKKKNNNKKNEKISFIHLTIVKEISSDYNSQIYDYIAFRILNLGINLDTPSLQMLLYFLSFTSLIISEDQHLAEISPSKWVKNYTDQILSNDDIGGWVDINYAKYSAQGARYYIGNLILNPIELIINFYQFNSNVDMKLESLSYTSDSTVSKSHAGYESLNNYLNLIPSIEKTPISFKGLAVEHIIETSVGLNQIIIGHYKNSIIRQILILIGSLSILGNPANLFMNVGNGVQGFICKPIEGLVQSPGEFVNGIGQGTLGLVQGVVGGALNTVNSILGNVAGGMNQLVGDEEYIAARRRAQHQRQKNNNNVIDGIVGGGEDLAHGIVGGITGLFTSPIQGAKEEGITGAFTGFGKGLVGLVAKPTAGAVNAVQNVTIGISNTVTEQVIIKQIRPRRSLPIDYFGWRKIDRYNKISAILQLWIWQRNNKLKFGKDKVKNIKKCDFFELYIENKSCYIIFTVLKIIIINHQEIDKLLNNLKNDYNNLDKDINIIFKRGWRRISFFSLSLPSDNEKKYNIIGYINLYEYGGEGYNIPFYSRQELENTYTYLFTKRNQMGLPTKIQSPRTLNNFFNIKKTNNNNYNIKRQQASELDNYIFGSVRKEKFPKRSLGKHDMASEFQRRISNGIENWRQLDLSLEYLLHDWEYNNKLLAPRKCILLTIINKNNNPIQISNVQLKSGEKVLTLNGPGYDVDSRMLASNSSLTLFAWSNTPNPFRDQIIKLNVNSTAFDCLASNKRKYIESNSKPGYQVGFIEKHYEDSAVKLVLVVN